MRTLILLALVAVAGAGVWLTAFDGTPATSPSLRFDEEEVAGLAEESPGGGLREIAAAPVVGVAGRDRGGALPPVNHDVFATPLSFDTAAKQVDGEAWLLVLEKHCGLRLPVRFASEGTWRRFRDLVIFERVPPAEIDLRTTLEVIRERGWEAEMVQQDAFLLIHPRRLP